jgi:hypothetical protein
MTKDEAELVAQQPLKIAHDGHGRLAIRTLVVAVLDESHRCGRGPLDMVTLTHPEREPRGTILRHR